MTKQIKTSIIIKATPQKVWKVLMDFKKYSEWNSFIIDISRDAKKESKLKIVLQGMTFKPKIISIKENTEFKWLGHFLIKGLFDGEHIFQLIENADGTTTFHQKENFKGVLVPFLSKALKQTKVGFEKMNEELKNRVEKK